MKIPILTLMEIPRIIGGTRKRPVRASPFVRAAVARSVERVAKMPYFVPSVRVALLAALAVVALVATDMYRQSPSQPPAVFAQTCVEPKIDDTDPLPEGIQIDLVLSAYSDTDPEYEYRLRLNSATDWPEWTAVPDNQKTHLYSAGYRWKVFHKIRGLEPLTEYRYQVRSKCGDVYSSPNYPKLVTTEKTRTYIMTLEDVNGMSVDFITEGESATLKLTLDDSEVASNIPFGIHVSLATAACPSCGLQHDQPRINEGEVWIANAIDNTSPHRNTASARMTGGSREAAFTLTAMPDAIAHSASPDDDEAEVEFLGFSITMSRPYAPDGFRLSYSGLPQGLVRIIDATPLIIDPAENQHATGSFAVEGVLEVGEVLTATPVNVDDPDGIPLTVSYAYRWHTGTGSGRTPIPGATSLTYTVRPDDIGAQLSVTASFMDLVGYSESLESPPTDVVPSGPEIRWPNGPQSGPFAHQTLTADTNVMNYADIPASPSLQFQWIYVDASGVKESDISGATSGTYGLSDVDVGKRIQVEVRYVNDGGQTVVRHANRQTPAVREGVELSPPIGLVVVVGPGVLRLSWTVVSGAGTRELSGFQYRYSPFNPPNYTASDYSSGGWQTVPGEDSARSLNLRGLVNQATYTIQVRSVDATFLSKLGADDDTSTAATTTATYRHKTC